MCFNLNKKTWTTCWRLVGFIKSWFLREGCTKNPGEGYEIFYQAGFPLSHIIWNLFPVFVIGTSSFFPRSPRQGPQKQVGWGTWLRSPRQDLSWSRIALLACSDHTLASGFTWGWYFVFKKGKKLRNRLNGGGFIFLKIVKCNLMEKPYCAADIISWTILSKSGLL